jgi:hypothetical protein
VSGAPSSMWKLQTSLLSLLVLGFGCSRSSDVKLTDLSGSATFAGSPIVYGTLEFIPDHEANHKGPSGNAQIHDGKYNTAEGGRGISPGPHVVRITAFDSIPAEAPADETVPFKATPPLFVGYAIKMDLQGGVADITVPDKAKGFDMYKAGRPSAPRPGDP